MSYAILQADLTPPGLEQLQRAFRHVPGLTATDAHIIGRDAFGILTKDLSMEQAMALQGALRTEGIETEIVDQSRLPELPPRKLVHRLDCLPEHLLIYDPLGRSFPLPWQHVSLVAAGAVYLTEFVRYQERQMVDLSRRNLHYDDPGEVQTFSREEQRLQLVGEIIITDAVLRYTFTAAKFNFVSLGPRNMENVAANFSLLMRDIIQLAPHAQLNRGAESLRNDATQLLGYPTRNAFQEEIIWMLWQRKKSA
jgi:hypothetical protein